MAQQSSEIKISLDSSSADRAIEKLTKKIQDLQKEATKASKSFGVSTSSRGGGGGGGEEERAQRKKEREEERAQRKKEREEERALKERERDHRRLLKQAIRKEAQQKARDLKEAQRLLKQSIRKEAREKERAERDHKRLLKQAIRKEAQQKARDLKEAQRLLKQSIEKEARDKERLIKETQRRLAQLRTRQEREELRVIRQREKEELRVIRQREKEELRVIRQRERRDLQLFREQQREQQRRLQEDRKEAKKVVGAAGKAAVGSGKAVLRGLSAIYGQTTASGMLRGILPFVGGIAGTAVDTRMQRTQQAAGMEALRTRLNFAGATGRQMNVLQDHLAGMGFGPQESLSMLAALQSQMGGRFGAGINMRQIAQFQRAGVGAQVFGAFGAGAQAGGGATGTAGQQIQAALGLSSLFEGQGLRGAGIERALAQIVSNTSTMAQEGLQVDVESMTRFVGGIARAAEGRGLRQFMGGGAMRIVSPLQRGAAGALGQMRGMYAGIGESALLAAAARGGGGDIAMMERLEKMRTTPQLALDALSGLPPEAKRRALIGLGLSTAGADLAMGVTSLGKGEMGAAGPRGAREIISGGMTLSAAQARADIEALRAIEGSKGTSVNIININRNLELLTLSLTSEQGAVTSALKNVSNNLQRIRDDGLQSFSLILAETIADKIAEKLTSLLP